ncbi:hypothetical protein [Maridesulfovibrio sp.]|uniref:hypothetical protein n=1 Tax=Maridesulfovibrio sp. TaxID=2795000 RepID=UPI0039EEA13D
MIKKILFIVFILVMAVSSAMAGGKTTMLISFEGSGAAYKDGPLAGTKLELLEFINPMEEISVPSGSAVTLNNFESSTIEKIEGPATFIIREGQIELLSGKQPEKKSTSFMPSGSGDKIAKSQVVNFGTVAFRKPLKAHGEQSFVNVIPGSKIRIKWNCTGSSSPYTVKFTEGKGDNAKSTVKKVKKSYLNIPAKMLQSGKTFTWEVCAAGKDEAIKTGSIRVINATQLNKLKSAQKEIKKLPEDDLLAKNAMEVSLYIACGINMDAAKLLSQLSKSYPRNVELSRMLQHQLQIIDGLSNY